MTEVFIQYGALGVICLMALLAVKVMYANAQKLFERERERADRMETELLSLNKAVREEYLTTISQATRAISDALAAIRKGN